MSSIDKYVEQEAQSLNRNVRVSKMGSYIVGTLNGEVVFQIADRYGYLNESERRAIAEGLENYEERKRLEEERIRRLIEEQKAELRNKINQAVSTKRQIISNLIQSDNNRLAKANESLSTVSSDLEYLRTKQFQVDSFFNKMQTIKSEFATLTEKNNQKYEQYQNIVNEISNKNNSSLSVEQYENLLNQINRLEFKDEGNVASLIQAQDLSAEVSTIKTSLQEILNVVNDLEKFAGNASVTKKLFEDMKIRMTTINITSLKDVADLKHIVDGTIKSIKQIQENEKLANEISNVSELEGILSAWNKINVVREEASYQVKDYRHEIIEKASKGVNSYLKLLSNEFNAVSKESINKTIKRLNEIIIGQKYDFSILQEVDRYKSEYDEIASLNQAYAGDYQEYQRLIEELLKYTDDKTLIPKFDVHRREEIKKQLLETIRNEKRESEKSVLHITGMNVDRTMEEMGYELFKNTTDANEYITEKLYTKKGYDGVLWQIVILSDGSFSRRVIGVNKITSETPIDYVLEVAEKMDKEEEPVKFLEIYQKYSGSTPNVTVAVEHDSENAIEKIQENGYHYFETPEIVEEYNKLVGATKPQVIKKAPQVQHSSVQQVRSSKHYLQAAAKQSMRMSNAN